MDIHQPGMESEPLTALAFVGVLVELAVFYAAPRVLAPLAFIPFGKSAHIGIGRRDRKVLLEPVDGELGYRDRRTERAALERLGEQNIFGKRYIAWIQPAHGTIVARTRYAKGGRGAGLIRTRLRLEGDRIVATTRLLPCPSSLWLAMLAALVAQPTLGLVVAALLIGGVQVWMPRGQLLQARDESLDHLRSMIRAARKERRSVAE